MKHSVKSFSLAFAAIAVLATSPAFAVEDDFGNDAPLSRQIVVQEADQKDEVKQLVAKLRKSRDEANNKTETQTAELVEEKVAETSTELVDDTAIFAPKVAVKIVEVEMPTVFDDNQIALYNDLTNAQQASLVKKLIKKYGYNMLYPTKTVDTYHSKYRTNGSYNHKTYSHNTGYNNHSTGYSRKKYTRSYSNSHYRSGNGCSK